MKLSENKDIDIGFKFNPCAVPFIPSAAKDRGNTVLSRMGILHVDTGDAPFWNRDDSILDGYEKITEMEEDLYFNCLPLHMFDSNENETSEKLTFSVESVLEKKLSSWLQDEEIFVHSQGDSSVYDESWSATPVSSVSPTLNEDLDHNSTSYGSLPSNSYDLTLSECHKEQPELSEAKTDQPETSSCGSDTIHYYSPFGTGMSSWLAGEKNMRKERSGSLKESLNAELQEEMNKDLQTVGNIWNDVDSNKTLGSAAICSWMQQISKDNSEDDLFTGDRLRDDDDDVQTRLSLCEFSSSLDRSPWPSNPEKKTKLLSVLGYAGQPEERRNLSAAENDDLLSYQNYIRYCGKDKLGLTEKDQHLQTSKLEPNSSSHHHHHLMHKYQNNVPFLEPEPMVYLPQIDHGILNHSAFPIFYISPSVALHQNAKHYPMYNPYMMHFAPQRPGFFNLGHHSSLPQFYPNIDLLAFNSLGIRSPAYLPMKSGPALELHQQLDICYEQFRHLENERKKAEAEMARQHPGKEITSDNTMTVPLLPPKPSRIDRLVVEILREHPRVVTLVSRMAQLLGIEFQPSLLIAFEYWMDEAQKLQTCRKNEMVNRKKYRMDIRGAAQKEKDIAALANALSSLSISTRKARTAIWCALQLACTDLPQHCLKKATVVARQSDQGTRLDSKPKTYLGFGYNGPSELFEQDVSFVDYRFDFYNDYDQDDGKDELNQEVLCDENEGDLDCEVFESGSQQEACCRESDYESYTEFGLSYDCQFQHLSKETKLQRHSEEPGTQTGYESSSADAGKETEVEVGGATSIINTGCEV